MSWPAHFDKVTLLVDCMVKCTGDGQCQLSIVNQWSDAALWIPPVNPFVEQSNPFSTFNAYPSLHCLAQYEQEQRDAFQEFLWSHQNNHSYASIQLKSSFHSCEVPFQAVLLECTMIPISILTLFPNPSIVVFMFKIIKCWRVYSQSRCLLSNYLTQQCSIWKLVFSRSSIAEWENISDSVYPPQRVCQRYPKRYAKLQRGRWAAVKQTRIFYLFIVKSSCFAIVPIEQTLGIVAFSIAEVVLETVSAKTLERTNLGILNAVKAIE